MSDLIVVVASILTSAAILFGGDWILYAILATAWAVYYRVRLVEKRYERAAEKSQGGK